MAGRKQTIEDKIKEAEAVVIKAKEKYDSALEELNRLVKNKKEMESRELMQAYEKSNRTFEEVLTFLGGSLSKTEDGEEDVEGEHRQFT